MAKVKVHPDQPPAAVTDPCSMSSAGRGRESFTIWMKSLVCHTNGCTVFDSKGEIVYRVENYDTKGCREIHLMDLQGQVLLTILKKKLHIFGCWNGYRGDVVFTSTTKEEKPWFQVTRSWCSIIRRDLAACQVTVGFNKYWIVSLGHKKQGFQMLNLAGDIVAEVKQKQLCSGMVLGDDVLTLEVEPYMDHSLIVALVTVYGLINGRL